VDRACPRPFQPATAWLAENVTYRFRDPHRGEIVVIHARGQIGGSVVPDPAARDLNLGKRVIGVPGDAVVGREGRVVRQRREGGQHRHRPVPCYSSRLERVLRPRRQPKLLAGQSRLRAGAPRRDLRARGSQLLAARAVRGSWVRQEPRPAGRPLLRACLGRPPRHAAPPASPSGVELAAVRLHDRTATTSGCRAPAGWGLAPGDLLCDERDRLVRVKRLHGVPIEDF
jgi:Signal peptidase, peptidase S26